MAQVAIVYHSGFGHTKVIAESVLRGAASEEGVKAVLLPVGDLPAPREDGSFDPAWDALHDADAIVFGCPTYMGSVSAGMKLFMEHSSGIWFTQGWKDKLAAGFTNGGGLSGDKLNVLTSFAIFAGQHSMIWVTPGLFPTGNGPEDLNRMGSMLGTMAQSDNAPPSETPPSGDHKSAEDLGQRVAAAAKRWVAGGATEV